MRTRRVVLLLGVLAVLGVGGYAAYRSPTVRSWFARNTEDGVEIAKLGDRKLDLTPAADAATGWFQWRGPTRDGRPPAGPFRADWERKPPAVLWRTPVRGGYSSCAVVAGKLYTQDYKAVGGAQAGRTDTGNERIVCLNAETGGELWDYEYGVSYAGLDYGAGPRATPTVEGNRVYAVGAVGQFVCLEAPADAGSKPRVVWRHDLIEEFDGRVPKWGVACSPLVEGDLVIVQPGGKGGSVVAFDKHSGEPRWRAGKNPSGYSSPIAATVGGQRVVFAMTGDALLVIRATDGTVTDSYDWATQHNGNIATPVVVDDYVFISSAYMQGCALLRAESGGDRVKLVPVYARRRPPGLQNHHASSVFKKHATDGAEKRYLFGFDGDTVARLKCVDFDTGKEQWDAGREVDKGTLILADNHLIIQTERGDLCLVEATPEEFRPVAKIQKALNGRNNWATPTLVDGRLYLRDDEKVVCYDVRP